jgi:hypothetical protein
MYIIIQVLLYLVQILLYFINNLLFYYICFYITYVPTILLQCYNTTYQT